MTGVFAVSRGVFDHPMFAPEPYTEREAWLWLISDAAWRPHKRRVGRVVVDLERGQTAHATRFFASKWKWSESRVRRFLNRLKTDAMVIVLTTRETTQITICNYEKYAFDRRTDDSPIDAQTDAPATHRRRRLEEGKKDNKKEDIWAVAKATRPDADQDFQKFREVYPKREGANPWQPARKSFLKALKAGATVEEIISGAKRFAAAERERINTPYIPQAVTWLNQQRWKDYPDHSPSVASPPPGMPSNEELIAKYTTRKNDETAKREENSVGKGSPVVESSSRLRSSERKLVLDEPGIAGVRSVGGLLSESRLGASRVQNANRRQGSDDADAMAGMVYNTNPASLD